MSQRATDIGRTNLIKLDIPTEGPPIASKPCTVTPKYHKFVDHEIKQLEEAGTILQSTSDWASPILVLPKKEDLRSGYYHIRLIEKTAFVTNKGKWIFHSPAFGINIEPLAFSYVLGKVLAQCTEFTLNY